MKGNGVEIEVAARHFETALVAMNGGKDGMGRAVMLYSGPLTPGGLREKVREFMRLGANPRAVFMADMARAGDLDDQQKGEAAYWRNLALMANALAAALDYERISA